MRIPNQFHFIFGLRPQTEPFHLVHYLCLASCIAVNRPERIVFHYQHEPWGPYWDRIRPALDLRSIVPNDTISTFAYADRAIARYRYAHLADIARLDVLMSSGGIYADIDTVFVAPLPREFFSRSCTLGLERVDARQPAIRSAGGSLCNAWIMAEPQAPFLRLWRERFWREFDGSWSAHGTALPYRLSRERPDTIDVEPARSFFHLDWTRAGVSALFEEDETLPHGVYSLHLWEHLWWERGRRDVSRFHAGRLTPAYVRHARTAYARLARLYLPEDVPGQDEATWRKEQSRARRENLRWAAPDAPRKLARHLLRRVAGEPVHPHG
jgi:hypothetical protein